MEGWRERKREDEITFSFINNARLYQISMIIKYAPPHITHLVEFFSFECNLWIVNVILALNQTNLQTTWLGIVSHASTVIQCPLQKCLQGWETLQQSIYNCATMRIQSQIETASHSLIISKVMVPLLMSSFFYFVGTHMQKFHFIYQIWSSPTDQIYASENDFKDWIWWSN